MYVVVCRGVNGFAGNVTRYTSRGSKLGCNPPEVNWVAIPLQYTSKSKSKTNVGNIMNFVSFPLRSLWKRAKGEETRSLDALHAVLHLFHVPVEPLLLADKFTANIGSAVSQRHLCSLKSSARTLPRCRRLRQRWRQRRRQRWRLPPPPESF